MSLLVVGDGPLRQEICEPRSELAWAKAFSMVPLSAFDQMPQYYKAASVFTLPSQATEPFGVVILEALAAGIPVVVNDDPIRRWIAAGQGYFVDPENIEAYAATLRSAVETKRIPAATNDLMRFDWLTIAQEWSDFCVHLVDGQK